jgi:hypothetical protein
LTDLATLLPCRRPELVARPLQANGSYLVRDRLRGESFQIGPEEHFLLARLDGTQIAEGFCAAFAERFGAPLTSEELQEFLDLARERGFLQQPDGDRTPLPLRADAFPDDLAPPQPILSGDARSPGRPSWVKRPAARLLRAAAEILQTMANFLTKAASNLQFVRLASLEFVPRLDDIFIVTYPRSGTTWMQMILYQLTTDGALDFPHI